MHALEEDLWILITLRWQEEWEMEWKKAKPICYSDSFKLSFLIPSICLPGEIGNSNPAKEKISKKENI